MEIKDDNKAMIAFLGLLFFLPLISLLLIKFIPFFQNGIPYFILYGFEAITPSISALLAVNIVYGKQATISFLRKSYVENKKVSNMLLACVLSLLIAFMIYGLCVIFLDVSILHIEFSSKKVMILLWALIAEELGWRGFLQSSLHKKLDKKIVPFAIGMIWSLWHYHFFLLGTISTPIILFTISCIIDSYIYDWLTEKSKQNIIPASIFHFMSNLMFSVLLIYLEFHNGCMLPYLFYIISSFIIMICFIRYECIHKRSL